MANDAIPFGLGSSLDQGLTIARIEWVSGELSVGNCIIEDCSEEFQFPVDCRDSALLAVRLVSIVRLLYFFSYTIGGMLPAPNWPLDQDEFVRLDVAVGDLTELLVSEMLRQGFWSK